MPVRRLVPVACCLALGACASPSPEFFGASEHRLTVDGVSIVVFHTADRAQAIRLDFAGRAAQRDMPARLVAAIEQATGCTVPPGGATGDSGVMTARLSC